MMAIVNNNHHYEKYFKFSLEEGALPETILKYRDRLGKLEKYLRSKEINIENVKPQTLVDFAEWYRTTPPTKKNKTLQVMTSVVWAFFDFLANKMDMFDRVNPADRLKNEIDYLDT